MLVRKAVVNDVLKIRRHLQNYDKIRIYTQNQARFRIFLLDIEVNWKFGMDLYVYVTGKVHFWRSRLCLSDFQAKCTLPDRSRQSTFPKSFQRTLPNSSGKLTFPNRVRQSKIKYLWKWTLPKSIRQCKKCHIQNKHWAPLLTLK